MLGQEEVPPCIKLRFFDGKCNQLSIHGGKVAAAFILTSVEMTSRAAQLMHDFNVVPCLLLAAHWAAILYTLCFMSTCCFEFRCGSLGLQSISITYVCSILQTVFDD